MLIVGIENPQGETHYVAAAFPSACGKTNLAMLIPPELSQPAGKSGRSATTSLDARRAPTAACGRSIPEAGYFGVAPGTSAKTNPNALRR